MKGMLLRALESGEKLDMIYMSKQGEISYRTIRVLALSNDSIRAYCYLRRKQRVFKLNHILSIGKIRGNSKGA